MDDLGGLTAYLRADMKDLQTKLKRATKDIRRFSIKTETLIKATAYSFRKIGSAVTRMTQTISRQVKRLGIVIAAGLVASVKAFASFEEQLANVSTMLDDNTMKYMPKYAKQLKNIAVEFGEGTKTLSKGLYDILSASVAPAKAMDVLRASTIAAKAGMTDTGIAADAITTILNSYQMSANEAGKVSDWLFAIVKRGKTTFAELAPNIGKVAAMASVAGLSFEEVGATIATMTRAGLQTELATTSLRALINTFLKGASAGNEVVEMAKRFDLELNSTTLRTIGLSGVLKKLKEATADELSVLMPNIRALGGFSAALKQAEGMASDLELMLHSTGLTQKAFAKMTDTLAFQMKRLWQAIKVISVGVGERFKEGIIDLANAIIKNRRIIEDWAIAFADRIVFVKDVLWGFLKYLKTDFKTGFQQVLDSLIVLLEATAKIAIDLAVRTGRGIWKGITENVGGGHTSAIYDEAEKAYEKKYGHKPEQKSFYVTGTDLLHTYRRQYKEPFDKVMQEIADELAEKNITESVFTGFTENAKKYLNEAVDSIKDSSEDIGDIVKNNLDKLYNKDILRWFKKVQEVGNQVLIMPSGMPFILNPEWLKEFEEKINKIKKLQQAAKDIADKWLEPTKEGEMIPEEAGAESDEWARDKLEAYRSMYSEMGRMSQGLYEVEKKLLNLQREEYEKFIDDKLILDEWYKEQVRKLDIERLKSSDSLLDGFKAAAKEMKNDMKTFGEMGKEVAFSIRDAFANAFSDMILEAKNFKEAATGFLKSVASAMVQIMSYQIATGIMTSSFMTGLFGGGGNTNTGGSATYGTTTVSRVHSGGIIGAGLPQVKVPEYLFTKAPKLHAGLQPDEYPAILQRGETVVPKGEPVNVVNKVEVINQTARPVDAEIGQAEFDGEKYITQVLIKDIYNYGPMRSAIQGIGANK